LVAVIIAVALYSDRSFTVPVNTARLYTTYAQLDPESNLRDLCRDLSVSVVYGNTNTFDLLCANIEGFEDAVYDCDLHKFFVESGLASL
jgi:hypothetical protein